MRCPECGRAMTARLAYSQMVLTRGGTPCVRCVSCKKRIPVRFEHAPELTELVQGGRIGGQKS